MGANRLRSLGEYEGGKTEKEAAGMDPLTYAAISGGTSMLGSIMGAKSKRKQQERQAKIDAAQKQGELQHQAHGQRGQAQGNSLGQLMNAYRDALLR